MTMTDREYEEQMLQHHIRAEESLVAATSAFADLLHLAETRDSGQIRRIAEFIAASYNSEGFKFDLLDLRVLDVAISDKILICLDCLRWAVSDLYRLVPDGNARIQAMIDRWGLRPKANG
ncbi:MAG: hypothetical protein IPG91_22000 [Ideonella sp.]|nr:hypothetical protein [Ideonella sp.]